MSKLIIPNIPNHYEGSGFEVDVTATQIIVRSKDGYQQAEKKKPEQQAKQNPAIGPVSSMLFKKIGLLK